MAGLYYLPLIISDDLGLLPTFCLVHFLVEASAERKINSSRAVHQMTAHFGLLVRYHRSIVLCVACTVYELPRTIFPHQYIHIHTTMYVHPCLNRGPAKGQGWDETESTTTFEMHGYYMCHTGASVWCLLDARFSWVIGGACYLVLST